MTEKTTKKTRKPARLPYQDPSLCVADRVRDLLGRMTLEEKVRQMSQRDMRAFCDEGRVMAAKARAELAGLGIGTLQDLRMEAGKTACAVNAIQKILVEETRLGIPGLVISECLHGHMSGGATIFPQAIGLASTWNPALVEEMASAAALEASAVGVAQSLSPDLDLARDPRWGRVEETYGEDPHLVSRMGLAYIRGMQGESPILDRKHLVCTAKHFAAHGSPEAGMNLAPVDAGTRQLRSLYLAPFRCAVEQGNVLSVMPAYSELDGIPAHASKLLLTRILRQEWGFQGYVYSDYGGVEMLHSFHKTAQTPAEAGRQALSAGMDLEAPNDFGYGEVLLELVRKGEVPEQDVDRAVRAILSVKFTAGLFEDPYADLARVEAEVNCDAHRALARELAQESIILLRNEGGLLPLDRNIASIAVIGPNADVARFGDYSMPKADAVTVLRGVLEAVPKKTRVRHARGCELYGLSREGFAEAVDLAAQSEVAIVVVGSTSTAMGGVGWGDDSGAASCGEGRDRTELGLEGVQEDLIRAVIETGTPTIVVFVHGRPYSVPWMVERVPALLDAWYPGEQGGHAVADVLFGKVNPSGKLPITVPRSVGHVPAFYDHKPSARGYYKRPGTPESPGRDYVFSSPEPLFAFGFGLSYTKFRYSNLRVSPRRVGAAGKVCVSVDVANVGEVKGKEVVQLYVNDVFSSVTTPVRSLKRFDKIELKPGQDKTVHFVLHAGDLELLDENMTPVVEPGDFEVMVADLKKTFTVVK